MIRDPEHANESYEDGDDYRESSSIAHIAYAAWRGPDFDPAYREEHHDMTSRSMSWAS